jgi:hypothetical protein
MRQTQYMIAFREYGKDDIIWQTSDFASLSYILNLDDVTEVEFEPIYGASVPEAVFSRTTTMQIWRKPRGSAVFVLEGNTEWLVTKDVIRYDTGPVARRTIVASHPNLLLQKRLIAYTSGTTQAEKTADNGANAPIVELMEQLVNENIGSLAESDRNMVVGISSVPYVDPAVEVSAPWRQLLSTLQDLAQQKDENGDRCYFSLDIRDNSLEFRIRRGALGSDKSSDIVFSVENGNVSEMTVTRDYGREINAIYVGGEGSGAEQIIGLVADPVLSPVFRWEDFLQAGYYIDTDTALEAEGRRQLDASTARRFINAKVMDATPFIYGRDFVHGDTVGLAVAGNLYHCTIFAVTVKVAGGVEEVEIYLDAEEPI